MDAPQIARQTTPHNASPGAIATERGEFAVLDAVPDGDPIATVLLVPGYTGSKEDFAPLLDPLSDKGFRVVAIDQRGQYHSPGTDDPASYSVQELGADLLSVAEQIGTRVHLVGHSFGGLVSRAAVIQHPDLVATLTLMSSGPSELPAGPRRSIIEASQPHLHSMGLERIYDAGQDALAKDPTWNPPHEPLRRFLRDRFVSSSPHALEHMGATMLSEPDRTEQLRATRVPLMVLYGREDNAWSPEAQSDMALRLGAREVVIESALHSPAIENPVDTAAELLRFWSDYPA